MSRFCWSVVGAAALTSVCWIVHATGPALHLSVHQTASRETVKLVLENRGDEPLRLFVDARKAKVELRAKGRRLGFCNAPASAFPSEPQSKRFVSLAPGQRATEELDLRFLCFGNKLKSLSKADAIRVTYRSTRKVDAAGGKLWSGNTKRAELVLRHKNVKGVTGKAPQKAQAKELVQLKRLGGHPDVSRADTISVTFELRGPRKAKLPVAVRPELFALDVVDPTGKATKCQLPASRVRPLRDFYDRLGRRRMSLDLVRLCPSQFFHEQGVYSVVPGFFARYDGADVGLSAWTGQAIGTPFFVRVRKTRPNKVRPVLLKVLGQAKGGQSEDAL